MVSDGYVPSHLVGATPTPPKHEQRVFVKPNEVSYGNLYKVNGFGSMKFLVIKIKGGRVNLISTCVAGSKPLKLNKIPVEYLHGTI